MTLYARLARCLTLSLATLGPLAPVLAAHAQKPMSIVTAVNADRIGSNPDVGPRAQLAGHLPNWVKPANDAGPAAGSATLHVDFVLARSPQVQASFDQLLADQQNPSSPRFHAWLTPQQIGDLYGPTQHDVASLTQWLTGQGFQIESVAPSRMFVRASAPVSTVASALSTSFRMYTVPFSSGALTSRLSASTEPSLPAVFVPIVQGIAGLSDVPVEPQHRAVLHTSDELPTQVAAALARNGGATASAVRPQASADPSATTGSGNHYVTPGDFAIIYDLAPAYSAGYKGTGQKVAVIGRSQVATGDIQAFENVTALPNNVHNTIVAPGGTDPGLTGDGEQGESTLDVERVIGTAPGIQADLVIASVASGGISLAAQYNVQTLLDPVMTISYGACEAKAGASNVNFWSTMFSQAAAEGISVFVSSGDSGAAGCETHGAAAPATAQVQSINYICSNPFNTCVGGTQFNDTSANWSSTNSTGLVSALGYIPEGVWNEPSSTSNGVTTYVIDAGGGGPSAIVTKPIYQAGTGVPADGFRDTPDVSLTGSGHDAYFGCEAVTQNGQSVGSCVPDSSGRFSFFGFAGTSASAPSMAAITAILNGRTAAKQGNLNPLLYRLAANTSNGVFHDVTVASSGVANCTAATPSICNNSTPTSTGLTGGLAGYLLTPGYDLSTGLGSVDVNNLLNAAITSTGTATTTTLTGTTGKVAANANLTFTATVAPKTGTGTPTGTVQFYASGTAFGAPVPLANGSATLTAKNTLASGDYTITAVYSGDTTFQSSTSSASLAVTSFPGGTVATSSVLSVSPNPATPTLNITVTFTVTPTGSGAVPTGTFTLNQIVAGSPQSLGSVTLVNGTATANIGTAPAGTYVLNGVYSGDATYAASTSPNVTLVVVASIPTTTTLTGPTSVATGSTPTYTATVSGLPATIAVSSTVNLLDGTTNIGTATLTKGATSATTGTVTFSPALAVGGHTLTAMYTGDANTSASTSAALAVTVASSSTPTTTVLSGPTAVTTAAAPTYTAVVSGLPTTAVTSTVTFADGGTTIGTAPVSKAAGTTSATVTFTPALPLTGGNHTITAAYTGDTTSGASTSNALTVVSSPIATSTTVTGPATLTAGQSGTYTVTINNLSPLASTASVRILDGTAVAGTVALAKTSTATSATATLTIALSAGSHSLTAVYAGDANTNSSTSPALVVAVTANTTTTVLTGPATVVTGSSATFTATVNGLPAGLAVSAPVNLFDGTAMIGTATLTKAAGTATSASVTFSPTLATGSHTLTAIYAGDAGSSPSTSTALVVTVAPAPTFTLSVGTPSFSSAVGTSLSDIVTVTGANGFMGNVTFTCNVAANFTATPTNVNPVCTPSPSTVTLGTSATTTLTITSTIPKATTGQGFASSKPGQPVDFSRTAEGMAALALLVAVFPAASRRRILRSGKLLTLALVLAGTGLLALTGCGGGGGNTFNPVAVGTASGDYIVTVTASGAPTGGTTVTQTATIPLHIQ